MRYQIQEPQVLRIQEMALSDRPRERMVALGAEALTDQELLTLLISSGSRSRSVTMIATDVLTLLDSKQQISCQELKQISGLGMAKATVIAAALELGRRRLPPKRRQISTPADIYPLVRHYATRMQEHFLSLALNGAHEVLAITVCSIGLVNRTIVHPREVLSAPVIR